MPALLFLVDGQDGARLAAGAARLRVAVAAFATQGVLRAAS